MLRFTFYIILFLFLSSLIAGVGLSWYFLPRLPEIETLKDVKFQTPLRVYSKNNALIAEFGEKRRIPITIEQVPERMIHAILASEDDRFYEHPGVDWQGLLRAVISLARTGEKKQGGSTITMQVARNFFLGREKTYLRKLNEIFLALKIEQELSKDDILELYLNKIYLGQRAYGVATAAYIYYGLTLDELSLPQMAMLAGLPKAPSTTNPITNPEAAKLRRQYVLQRMLKVGFISEEEFTTASESEITARLHKTNVELEAPYVAEMVRADLFQLYGDVIYTDGLSVYTTLIDNNQLAANQAVRKSLLQYDQRHGYRGPESQTEFTESMTEEDWTELLKQFSDVAELYPALVVKVEDKSIQAYLTGVGLIKIDWPSLEWAREYLSENRRGPAPKSAADIVDVGDIIRVVEDEKGNWRLSQIPEVEGALVSIDPNNGATLALNGGFDFYKSKFNRVTQAKRQAGSGFKPYIYSAALASGETAASIINDAPIVLDDPGLEDEWRPENYGRDYKGPMRLRQALTQSRNLVSIRLLNKMGLPFALEHIGKFGFNKNELPGNLSLSLGSGEITPWQQVKGYSVFANGGYAIEPYYIERIEDSDGIVIYQANPITVCKTCDGSPEAPANSATEQTTINLVDNDSALDDNSQENVISQLPGNLLTEPAPRNAKRVVEESNIWLMNSITRDVVRYGTGRKALSLGRTDLSGKTGTTNDQRDAWFCGFNGDIVSVVWVGFDKFLPLGSRETGARAALPMWIDYMKVALEGKQENIMERPEGLVNVRINPLTGKPASSNNPDAFFETFRYQYAPKANTIENISSPYSDGSRNDIQDIF